MMCSISPRLPPVACSHILQEVGVLKKFPLIFSGAHSHFCLFYLCHLGHFLMSWSEILRDGGGEASKPFY